MRFLIVTDDSSTFARFARALEQYSEVEEVVETGKTRTALDWTREGSVGMVVVDQQLKTTTGVSFIEALVKVNPMINTALVSSLAPGDFHEATEGLGVLMQLSPHPGEDEAKVLMEKLSQVAGLMRPVEM